MPIIWIVDTSIFLNVLQVPGYLQGRDDVLRSFNDKITNKDTLMLPLATILETGNHIVNHNQINGNQKRQSAENFVNQVRNAHNGVAPWRILPLPNMDNIINWLNDFPDNAMRSTSLGDHTIIKTWEEQSAKFPNYTVCIWTLDEGLRAYSHPQ